MLRIGICHDSKEARSNIKRMCDKYFKVMSAVYEYIIFSSVEQILGYNDGKVHLVFLDVEMNGIDCIEVMNRLEKKDNVWRVVFVSGHSESVWDSFCVKTLAFLRKPVSYESVSRCLDIARNECLENMAVVFNKDTDSCVELNAVLYIEGAGNYVRVYTKNDNFIVSGNLKKWQNKLKGTFIIRTHKSFLVNMYNVRELGKEVTFRDSDMRAPMGRKYKREAAKAFQSYLMRLPGGNV